MSSASGPKLVATMLEQLAVQPGQRVLEIGTATGINAALLADSATPATPPMTGLSSEALRRAQQHNGLGHRLFDGRQVAIIAHCAAMRSNRSHG